MDKPNIPQFIKQSLHQDTRIHIFCSVFGKKSIYSELRETSMTCSAKLFCRMDLPTGNSLDQMLWSGGKWKSWIKTTNS